MIQQIVLLSEFELGQLKEIADRLGQDVDFTIRAAIGTYIASYWQPRKQEEKIR